MKDFWNGFEKQAAEKTVTVPTKLLNRAVVHAIFGPLIAGGAGMAGGYYLGKNHKKGKKK